MEFILREGDIDNRRGRGSSPEAMQEGSRIHRKIQKSMGASYRAEVPLSVTIEEEDYLLVVEGRADGIETEDTGVTIDEIKGIYGNLELLEAPVGVHLAQGKMLCLHLCHAAGTCGDCRADDLLQPGHGGDQAFQGRIFF